MLMSPNAGFGCNLAGDRKQCFGAWSALSRYDYRAAGIPTLTDLWIQRNTPKERRSGSESQALSAAGTKDG
jgi:hypothetical protein